MAEGAAPACPQSASFGFVTGGQMAHFTCLAAARHHLLAAVGWDVERDGLGGAPPIRVVAGANRHATLDRALRFLGIGTASIHEVPADEQGRVLMDALRDELGRVDGPTIVCAQAGDINTGAFDDLEAAADAPARPAPGSMSTAQSASGQRPARRSVISSPASNGPTPGRPTRTSSLNVPVRLGDRVLRAPGVPPGRPRRPIRVPRPRGRGHRARCDRLRTRALAAGARLRDLRGAPVARPHRRRGSRRPLLRPGASARRGPRRAPRMRSPERRRPEPGADPLRGRCEPPTPSSAPCRRAARRG